MEERRERSAQAGLEQPRGRCRVVPQQDVEAGAELARGPGCVERVADRLRQAAAAESTHDPQAGLRVVCRPSVRLRHEHGHLVPPARQHPGAVRRQAGDASADVREPLIGCDENAHQDRATISATSPSTSSRPGGNAGATGPAGSKTISSRSPACSTIRSRPAVSRKRSTAPISLRKML